jgi:hypothetical protein
VLNRIVPFKFHSLQDPMSSSRSSFNPESGAKR